MADIELVIKIPEELKNKIDNANEDSYKAYLWWFDTTLCCAIKDGTPLPKGHGDLVDRRELKKEVYTTTEWNGDIHRIIYEASVDDARPIIEADKENKQ